MDKKFYVTPEMEEVKIEGQMVCEMQIGSGGFVVGDDEVDTDY